MIACCNASQNTLQTGTKEGLNVVAFGGGAASTLAAYLAHAVFEGKSVAVFVRLPGTKEEDVVRVKYLAAFIGKTAITSCPHISR